MPTVFQKLNLTTQKKIQVYNVPDSFSGELDNLKDVEVERDPRKPRAVQFALAFAVTQAELDRFASLLAPAADGDALIWFAYAKGTSKRYKCEFNRDTGWHVMTAAGFETVRQIAIDEDWSALRFRRSQFVKTRKAK
jgi:hypothetical protein